jgi:AcrR family transcriptional regulator
MDSERTPASDGERRPGASARGEQRRAEIVQAALDLFTERGYHDTGVADIASRLRMSHGTFYRYFESKRHVLEHLVDEVAARIQIALGAGNAAGLAGTIDEYRDQVAAIVDDLFRLVHDDPRIGRLLLFEATGVDAAMTDKVLGLIDKLRAVTAGYLRHGIEAGFLPTDLDVVETARALNGIAFAGALTALRTAGDEPADPERFAAAALRLMFDGIAGSW